MVKMISLRCQEIKEQHFFSPTDIATLDRYSERRAYCKAIYFVHGIDKVIVHDISSLGGLFHYIDVLYCLIF
jgi:hypothetical protein